MIESIVALTCAVADDLNVCDQSFFIIPSISPIILSYFMISLCYQSVIIAIRILMIYHPNQL